LEAVKPLVVVVVVVVVSLDGAGTELTMGVGVTARGLGGAWLAVAAGDVAGDVITAARDGETDAARDDGRSDTSALVEGLFETVTSGTGDRSGVELVAAGLVADGDS
jgi:hypothetical protein